jgi:phosphatidate cytidylyltransferase
LGPELALPATGGELRRRVLAAAVLAPVALATAVLGGVAFAGFVVVVAVLGFWEWTAISRATEPPWARIGVGVCLAAGLLSVPLADADWPIGLIALPALLALLAGFWREPFLWLGLGLVYVAIPSAAMIVLREAEPHGRVAILFLFLVVWATDVAAYFGGRRLGGPKLWPRVSPKKTWSGALSGLVAGMAAGGLTLLPTSAGPLAGLLIAAPLSVAAQAGDLLESALKRHFGVKDASHIIPGHGGVLDRVDGLFGAAALAWLLAALGAGADILALPRDIVDMARGRS